MIERFCLLVGTLMISNCGAILSLCHSEYIQIALANKRVNHVYTKKYIPESEPTTLALISLGSLTLLRRKRK